MALSWIASPVDNEVRAVLDLAQRARNLATQLGGDFGWTVSQRGVTVKQPSQLVRQGRAFFLSLTSGIAHSIDERHVGFMEKSGGSFDGFVERRFFAVDQGIGVFFFDGVIKEPCGAQDTSLFGLMNPNIIMVELDVVTNTSTESASCIIYYFKSHQTSRLLPKDYTFYFHSS